MDNTAQKSLPLSGQTFLFSTVECGKHMETLHKARLTALHAICVQIFRHIPCHTSSMPAEFLSNLPKNLTTHLTYKLYAVFPKETPHKIIGESIDHEYTSL